MRYFMFHVNKKKQKTDLMFIRYLLIICTLLQLLVFIGYFIDNVILQQICWNIWIPMSLFALMRLGVKVSITYMNISELQVNMENEYSINEILGLIFWFVASVINVAGTILGFVYSKTYILVICWATWKIFASISLVFVMIFVIGVHNSIRKVIKKSSSQRNLSKLIRCSNKLIRLAICLGLIILVHVISAVFQYIWLYHLIRNESTVFDELSYRGIHQIMLVYLPRYTILHVFILKYTWTVNASQYKEVLFNRQNSLSSVN